MTIVAPSIALRAAIYVRSATVSQADGVDRLEEQAAACRQLAGSLGDSIVAEYRDAGFAGTSLVRSGLQAMLETAGRHEVDVIVCERPDRLARGDVKLSEIEQELARLGVTVHYASGGGPECGALTAALASLDAQAQAARKAR